MRVLRWLVLLLACAAPAAAQTAVVGSERLAWDQSDAAPTAASAFTYRAYIDSAPTGTTLAGVTCTAAVAPATGSACTAPLPALTSGVHTIALTAAQTVNGQSAESIKSTTVSVRVVITVAPSNVRIVSAPAAP